MNRPTIVAGNWKMNTDLAQATQLTKEIIRLSTKTPTRIILAPPGCFIPLVSDLTADLSYISLGAQNVHQLEQGAYTGEIAAPMLKSLGVSYVIVGHSERRKYFNEDDALILAKTQMALKHDLQVIYCCGEELSDRQNNHHQERVHQQLSDSLLHLNKSEIKHIIIAYEPVWAIGTGKTASPQQAQNMHAFIRSVIRDTFGPEPAQSIPILYGGSVKPSNAAELFNQPDIDGGLIGGASLDPQSFVAIHNTLSHLT